MNYFNGIPFVGIGQDGETILPFTTFINFVGATVTRGTGENANAVNVEFSGGGLQSIPVADDDEPIVNATAFNFTGAGVTVTDEGAGVAGVAIAGGSSSQQLLATMNMDSATTTSRAFAYNGHIFTPNRDINIHAILQGNDTQNDDYRAMIAGVDGSNNLVAPVFGPTQSFTTAGGVKSLYMPLSAPYAIAAGARTGIFVGRSTSGNTPATTITNAAIAGGQLPIPGELEGNVAGVAQATPINGSAVSLTSGAIRFGMGVVWSLQ